MKKTIIALFILTAAACTKQTTEPSTLQSTNTSVGVKAEFTYDTVITLPKNNAYVAVSWINDCDLDLVLLRMDGTRYGTNGYSGNFKTAWVSGGATEYYYAVGGFQKDAIVQVRYIGGVDKNAVYSDFHIGQQVIYPNDPVIYAPNDIYDKRLYGYPNITTKTVELGRIIGGKFYRTAQ